MFNKNIYKKSIFIDIKNEILYDEKLKSFFIEKNKLSDFDINLYDEKALNYAEFSKLSAFSCGYVIYNIEDNTYKTHIKSFEDTDEKKLLDKIIDIFDKMSQKTTELKIIGFGSEKFIVPFIVKRLLINKMNVPSYFNIINYKTWDSNIYDLMKIWDLTSYAQTSLNIMYSLLIDDSEKQKDKTLVEQSKTDLKKVIELFKFFENSYE